MLPEALPPQLEKPLMEDSPPWKAHLTSHGLHPAERKTHTWCGQSGSASELETTSPAFSPHNPLEATMTRVLGALAEMCCGLCECITAASYARVSIQGHFW